MSMTLNERNPNVVQLEIGTVVSAQTLTVPGIYFRKHSRIKNVYFVDQLGIAKSSSDYQTITLQDNAATPVPYAAVATSSAASVVNTQLAMPLTTPVGDTANQPEADVPAGTMLNIALVGTGHAVLTKAKVIVEWYPL